MTNNKDIIDNINRHQNDETKHPLTCGIDSNHKLLKPIEMDGKVALMCDDCGYIQRWIPVI